jgi:hypothetical protein
MICVKTSTKLKKKIPGNLHDHSGNQSGGSAVVDFFSGGEDRVMSGLKRSQNFVAAISGGLDAG